MLPLPRRMAPGERLTAANYNSLLDYVRRITPRPGANVKVDYRLGGAVISGTPGGPSRDLEQAPFTVRRHEGQWEIYLPDGCVNVGGTCAPINPAASTGGEDHEEDDAGWRILHLDESTGTEGTDAGGKAYRAWCVTVHVKASAKMYGVDGLDAPARRLMFAGAQDRLNVNPTDDERYRDTPGDSFAFDVAIVRVTSGSDGDDEEEAVREVTQLRKKPVDAAGVPAPTGFDLVWYFSAEDGELEVEKVYCVRQLASMAGISVTGDTMTDVTDAEWIYAKIETADIHQGSGIVDVVSDPGNDVYDSSDTVVWLALMRMKKNTVVGDYRENSLKNVQVYRA